ncbi:MAG TPA: NEW3 domain-containing protein [Candidatus Deferrimicrobiaceae bacterium]|nr:NEW3 domain-containing protein [Candidatus Deferrimicrobiaceae bacterium]
MSARWIRGLISVATAALLATGLAPAALAVETLSLTTPYPAIVASPGTRVSFNLDVETSPAARVDLTVSGVPAGWTATLRGGSFVVTAIHTDGEEPTSVRLDVDVPADATGSHRITVTAESEGTTRALALDIDVEADVAGEVTIRSDIPGLRGSASDSFSFTITIRNDTDEDLTYTAVGQGPSGWTVEARPSTGAQAASAVVRAGATANLSVTVRAPSRVDPGTYDLQVLTTVGTHELTQPLTVEITGSYTLSVSTPTGVLSASGNAGGTIEQQFTLTNTGTAPITNVKMTASLPANWTVDWGDDETVASVPPDQPVTVTAQLTPAGDAIAGDYLLTIRGTGDQTTDSVEIRYTVNASILGAVVGIALIAAAFGGLWWVFRRYGRR